MPIRPTPLRARHDGWTPERQRLFISALTASRSVTSAAKCAGMSPRSAYNLRDHPAAVAFRKAWKAALAVPRARSGPGPIENALADETMTLTCGGVSIIRTRPIPANQLIRLLNRAATMERKSAKTATS